MIEPAYPNPAPSKALTGQDDSMAPRLDSAGEQSVGDFSLHLERVFRGPLDLLLQLVKDKELEIHHVSLAEVAETYCAHVRSFKNVNVDEAADYLVIAATLLAIKSRSLLPAEEVELEEDPFDPGEELVQQLLAYKELRAVADQLLVNWDARGQKLPAGGRWLSRWEPEEGEEEKEWDLGDISIWDLLTVVSKLEEETGFLRPHQVQASGRPLKAYVQELWEKVRHISETTWKALLQENGGTRADAPLYLVALLELAKQQQVDLKQNRAFADVYVQRAKTQPGFDLDDVDSDFDGPTEELEPEVEELLE